MGQVRVDIDLFCAGCSNELRIEDSSGTHVLITPCIHCKQTEVEALAKEKKVEEVLPESKVSRDAKAAECEVERLRIRKEKELISGVGVKAPAEEEGFDD